MKRLILPILLVCVLALVLPAAASALTYDEAVDELVASGYTHEIEDYLTSLGTDPLLGFRLAGTGAEHDASYYVRDQLQAMGLSDVRLEPVPVDAWDFKGATVAVGGKTFTASSFAGTPGTDGPLTAEIVYVGNGTAADFDAAGDVTGKIVLYDGALDYWWLNMVGAEATVRGAVGAIMTRGPDSYPWYDYKDALGSNDAEYDLAWVPMVYVAWQDGDWIKAQLKKAKDPVTATMTCDVTFTMAEDGGVGYNVVGVLEGSDPSLAPVLLASHVDAHFRAGLDDTGAVVNELLTAKAMTMSGEQPKRTTIFFFTCAEEYGYTNCWYDWAIGAWYAITHEHPDWAGQVALMLNLELMAEEDAVLKLRGAADVLPFLEGLAAGSEDVLPNGYVSEALPNTWTDQWSWSAAGVPTVTVSAGGPEYDRYYHTDLENKDRVDHGYLGGIAKWNHRVLQGYDSGLLPYDLLARGDQVLASVRPGKLVRAGVSGRLAADFKIAATKFRAAARKWEARKSSTAEADVPAVNDALLALEKTINATFTSRDAYDFSAYPQAQGEIDGFYLAKAVTAAKAGNVAQAKKWITYVGTDWYLSFFSPSVYQWDLSRHYPDTEHITWGDMGTPPYVVDATDAWLALDAGDFATAVAELKAERAAVRLDLRARVENMTAALEGLTKDVRAL